MKKALATVAALFLAAGAPYSVSADLNVGFAAQAQNNTVTGVVKDTKGEPLIGATVMVDALNSVLVGLYPIAQGEMLRAIDMDAATKAQQRAQEVNQAEQKATPKEKEVK